MHQRASFSSSSGNWNKGKKTSVFLLFKNRAPEIEGSKLHWNESIKRTGYYVQNKTATYASDNEAQLSKEIA